VIAPNLVVQPAGHGREEDIHQIEAVLLTLSPVKDDLLPLKEGKELLLVLSF